ncbi:hypothetical protein N7451_000338 [Penicillium sp. IBT 35674x]|nr:hypothetical protein N7451_000338 [Penicillium sp. IBT 35674x]
MTSLNLNATLLLHTLPLATSTATLAHALLELHTTSAFLIPNIRTTSNTILPTWFKRVFNRAVITVVGLNMTTIVTAATTLYLDSSRNDLQTTRFYWMGLLGAIGHLAFVPFVAGPVKQVIEGQSERENEKEGDLASAWMAKWVGVHQVRMLVADLPAWICFLGAVLTL